MELFGIWSDAETALATLNETAQKPYKFSVSYGLVSYDPQQPIPDFTAFIKEADELMYENKRIQKAKLGEVPR